MFKVTLTIGAPVDSTSKIIRKQIIPTLTRLFGGTTFSVVEGTYEDGSYSNVPGKHDCGMQSLNGDVVQERSFRIVTYVKTREDTTRASNIVRNYLQADGHEDAFIFELSKPDTVDFVEL